jgi:hypothetical protein
MRILTLPFAAVLCCFAALSAAQMPCEADKNNSLDTAADLKVLESPSYVMNQCVSAAGDREDYFRFTLAKPTEFNLIAGGGANASPFAVELMDRNGVRIARTEGGTGRSASIGMALPAGTYHVRFIAVQGTTHYTMGLYPFIETTQRNLKTGSSLAWSSMVIPQKPLARVDFQIAQPAAAGSHWVIDAAVKPIDSKPFVVNHEQYRTMRYVAGKAGSVETVRFRLVFVETGEEKWRAVRITSIP